MANEEGRQSENKANNAIVEIDWNLYEELLCESDLSDQEKREFIESLWYIICTFVDLGFGIEPTQLVLIGRDASQKSVIDNDGGATMKGSACRRFQENVLQGGAD